MYKIVKVTYTPDHRSNEEVAKTGITDFYQACSEALEMSFLLSSFIEVHLEDPNTRIEDRVMFEVHKGGVRTFNQYKLGEFFSGLLKEKTRFYYNIRYWQNAYFNIVGMENPYANKTIELLPPVN